MKRSEILLIIAKELYKQGVILDQENGTYNVDRDFEAFKQSWIEDAEDILTKLEDAGMSYIQHGVAVEWENEERSSES